MIPTVKLPILAGPLRGRWWLPGSRGKVLRVLCGTYEPEQTRLFAERIGAHGTVLDVGAHAGYYSLLASTLIGRAGTVWSFEPDPHNARFLRRHLEINRCGNVHVVEAAVSDQAGTAHFAAGSGSGTGRLADAGGIEVETVRLDDVCQEHGIAPSAVKIDVEGAEAAVLRGACETIARFRPVLFLSTHGPAVHRECVAVLREMGYAFRPIAGRDEDSPSEFFCMPVEE